VKNRFRLFIAILTVLVASVTLTACFDDVSTTSASCAFIVNDKDTDRSIEDVIFPGQAGKEGTDKNTKYFPCNSRTYGINKGNKKNANGERIGDRFNLAPGTTSTGADIKVALTAYWTLNQDPDVLKGEFYSLCEKYDCYSDDRISNSSNYADPGWNGMLGENMGEAIDRTARRVTADFPDELWQKGTQTLYDRLGEQLSKEFAKDVRVATGYSKDLFCGSGNSGWSNPSKPGEGNFTCTNVRFVVDDVVNEDAERQKQANEANGLQSQITDNQKELQAARAKYGDLAELFLGLQDYADSCPKHQCPPVVLPQGVYEFSNN
jgi:hypothetical protein